MKPGRRYRRAAAHADLLILPDGRVLAHNLTRPIAAVLSQLNPADQPMRERAGERSGVPESPHTLTGPLTGHEPSDSPLPARVTDLSYKPRSMGSFPGLAATHGPHGKQTARHLCGTGHQ